MERKSTSQTKARRARLLIAGHTYRSFAAKLGVSEATVKAAVHGVRGKRSGTKARKVLSALEALRHAA
jgi:DNA-binding CsgD family transcriptional regulator